jgi:hypothetical protein
MRFIFILFSMKANYEYDTPYGAPHEPGIGLFIGILFVQLFLCIIVFVGIESECFKKEFLKTVLKSFFCKRKVFNQTNYLNKTVSILLDLLL